MSKCLNIFLILGAVLISEGRGPRAADGAFLFKFGSGRDFNRPLGVAVDSTDRIIVADQKNDRIQVFVFRRPCWQKAHGKEHLMIRIVADSGA